MTHNKVPVEVLDALWGQEFTHADPVQAWLGARLCAYLMAGRLDRDVERERPVPAGSALAVHIARVTSVNERERLARTLRQAVWDAHHDNGGWSSRVPLRRDAIAAVEDVIDDVTLRLHAPNPVRARGMARLRMLLADGTGPLYRQGRRSLAAELRGVLAAL
jgi:hypothetical protein